MDLIENRLRPDALIVADDADRGPERQERVRSPDDGNLSVSFGEDVELSIQLG